MMLNDMEILELCMHESMIYPFKDKLITRNQQGKCISYGLSSYGYDVRVADEYKIFSNAKHIIVDPKNFNDDAFVDHKGDYCIIPPNSFVLCRTVEHFNIPKDVTVVFVGKSTLARCGLYVGITPAEAGWSGVLTVEVSNTTPLPAKIYSNEGIAQALFFKGNPCKTSYADRNGKYQDQTGITLPKV